MYGNFCDWIGFFFLIDNYTVFLLTRSSRLAFWNFSVTLLVIILFTRTHDFCDLCDHVLHSLLRSCEQIWCKSYAMILAESFSKKKKGKRSEAIDAMWSAIRGCEVSLVQRLVTKLTNAQSNKNQYHPIETNMSRSDIGTNQFQRVRDNCVENNRRMARARG